MDPKTGDAVLVGGRPEQLVVSKSPIANSVKGKVHIIQHLGAFIRYEVEVGKSISPTIFEIDNQGVLRDVHENDDVYVGAKEDRISLFSPEGREL